MYGLILPYLGTGTFEAVRGGFFPETSHRICRVASCVRVSVVSLSTNLKKAWAALVSFYSQMSIRHMLYVAAMVEWMNWRREGGEGLS